MNENLSPGSPNVSSHGQGKDKQISPDFDIKSLNPSIITAHLDDLKKKGRSANQPSTGSSDYDSLKNPGMPQRVSPKFYVFGIYIWKVAGATANIDGIYRDGFLELIQKLGFLKRYKSSGGFQYILEHENVIKAVDICQIRDAVVSTVKKAEYIDFEYKGLRFEATAEFQIELFLRNSPSLINDAILGHLPNHSTPVLRDKADSMFFAFKNGVAQVSQKDVVMMDYSKLQGACMWEDHMINRSFAKRDDYMQSKYAKFIVNIANHEDDRISAFKSAIGYLLHNHSRPTTARAVIAYDQELSKKNQPQGGSGKGVFNQALQQLRSVAVIDGKKVKPESQFSYQQVTERTQIIYFDDVRSDFDFLMLNSNLTTGWQIEHKRIPAFRYSPEENPKTYLTCNTILKAEGSTAERRQFILEFAPYYLKLVREKVEPIIHVHGCMFFSDEWDEDEWNRFYSFMLECCRYYLEKGLQFYELRNVSKNKLLQLTSDDFAEWIQAQSLTEKDEYNITKLFQEYKEHYYGDDKDFKQRTFTNWLKIYAETINCTLKSRRSSGVTYGKFTLK